MIPIKLIIKNFASYGPIPQTVNFEPYNLICLSGKNGHGKSALFEALTWAIWGQARKQSGATKPDEGLLRLGESKMSVQADFICNNNYYRVKREFGYESKKPYSYLEFGIIDQVTNNINSLTDKTIRLTQAKIEVLIGLSYDSFVNSAFLRQGQANEFSKKTPADRKEILSEILGLNKLELIKKKAIEKSKEAISQKLNFIKQIDSLKEELEKKIDIKAKACEINDNLQELAFKESHINSNLNKIAKEKEVILKKHAQLDQIKYEQEYITNLIKTNYQDIIKKFTLYRLTNKNKNKKIDFKELEQKKISLQKDAASIIEKVNLYNKTEEAINSKKGILENYQNQKKQDITKQIEQTKINYLSLLIQSNKLEENKKKEVREYNKIEKEIEKIKNHKNNLQSKLNIGKEEKILAKRDTVYQKHKALYPLLKLEFEKNNLSLKLLQEQHISNCPTCDQGLNNEKKAFLILNFNTKNSFLKHRIKKTEKLLNNLLCLIKEQSAILNKHKENIDLLKIDEIKKKDFLKLLTRIKESLEKLDTEINIVDIAIKENNLQKERVEYELKNLKDLFIDNLGHEITELRLQINSLDINIYKKDLLNINLDLEQIDYSLSNYNNFLRESLAQEQRKEDISQQIIQTKLYKKKEHLLLNQIEHLDNNSQLTKILEQETTFKSLLTQINNKKESLILEKGSIDQQVKIVEQKEKLHNKLKVDLAKTTKEQEEYAILAIAFGKDGIQALLIEDAIPEIEQEANNLLARLTNNQSQLTIESLRDLKSGNTKETLDIKISDSSGTRPYELFSGGEAFRIDFALRVAISKLLARRAGTDLQTLIIDEGFGSQDEEGLSYVMEAIHHIQEDFAKIIIISHLPTLKEQFPVNFLVHKSAHGTAIKIIEQG